MFKNQYRIVSDNYCGYECQVKRWWFPIVWFEMNHQGFANTFPTLERAKKFIESNRKLKVHAIYSED